MPRSLQEILDHAEELATKLETNPGTGKVQDVEALRRVRDAAAGRAAAERELSEAVAAARAAGCSWAAIAVFLGTSGEAARQRYAASASAGEPAPAAKKSAKAAPAKKARAEGSVKTRKMTATPKQRGPQG